MCRCSEWLTLAKSRLSPFFSLLMRQAMLMGQLSLLTAAGPPDDRTLPATMRTLIQGSSSLRRFLRSLFCSSLRRRRSKEPRLSRQSGSALTEAPKVTDKTSAAKLLKQWREEAKRQHLAPPDETRGVTFAAAVSYLRAGRSKLFVKPLVIYFGETPLVKIGQAEIDAAVAALLPNALPQTRNRSVYTPALAIIRHAGIVKAIQRPKWTGGRRLDWLRPDDATRGRERDRHAPWRPHDVPAVRRPAT